MKKICAFISAALMLAAVSCSESAPAENSNSKTSDIANVSTDPGGETVPAEDIVLTFATYSVEGGYSTGIYEDAIEKFNSEPNGYRIEVKNYREYYDTTYDGPGSIATTTKEGMTAVHLQLMTDIMKGGIVDILPYGVAGSGSFEILANKGAFADLYQFMEIDPDINTTTLNSHVLSLFEQDGKLPYLTFMYTVDTLIGRTEYVGKKENWTFDEFVSRWNEMPSGSVIEGHDTRDYVYMTVLRSNIGRFLDYSTGQAYFDSPEFLEMLNFIGTFPNALGYKPEMAFNSPDFCWDRIIYGFHSFHDNMNPFDGYGADHGPFTLVGYPSEDGSGAFIDSGNRAAICAASSPEKQQGAWLFLKMLADADFQYEHCFEQMWNDIDQTIPVYQDWGFPINNAAYERAIEQACEHEGEENLLYVGGEEPTDMGHPTRAECDRITAYINSIDRANNAPDNDIWDIINDELFAFFNGEQSAEEAASLIQNRAAIMVSEKS